MLRTLILLATHLVVFGCGAGIVALPLRARRQENEATAAALASHELYLDAQSDAPRGRHRARPVMPLTAIQPAAAKPQPRSLLDAATFAEAYAMLNTRIAERAQERRQFVELMTTLVGPARIRQHVVGHARVA